MDQQKPTTEQKSGTAAVGAVMVVGGGVAGMQASLDLAEAGYKVYMVEKSSAIGGHMAQLDKTFPTNDCAMCSISPKLVEVGRHRNIQILTNTEVLGLEGAAGNFTAKLAYKARYINVDTCKGCGDCAKVCPVSLPDKFNEGLSQRKAAYKLYPQATPNAYAIEKLGVAPCRHACPLGQRAQGYIALVREGRYQDAMRTITEDNPFPGICGRICYHGCETACARGKADEPINIRALKRFVADWTYKLPRVAPTPSPRKYEEKVAIVGAGPSGLTAAQDLCKLGYGVTVLEALPVAGGMLRVGVPEFRMPTSVIDREVQDIVDLGVELKLNTRVTDMEALFQQGYKAVLLALGTTEGAKSKIPGADLEGTIASTTFLREVRLGNAPNLAGKRVVVVGAGNIAVDAARTAVRLGAAEVHAVLPKAKMTAPEEEVEPMVAEGVVLHTGCSAKRVVDNGQGHVAGLECLKAQVDAQGKPKAEMQPGSEHTIACDCLIFAVGQRADLSFLSPASGVEVSKTGTVAADAKTLATKRAGVFAAGDVVAGTQEMARTVLTAITAGHRSATSIHQYLRGEALKPAAKTAVPPVQMKAEEIKERMVRGEIKRKPRVAVAELPVRERAHSFAEVELGYTEEQAREEARRCLECGICSECLSCSFECQVEGCIDHDELSQTREINVGAVVLAPGYEAYSAELSEEFGWGRYKNVVTALQFERLLSASGPTEGHVVRPSDGKPAHKIAFLQCIGSRDQKHDYCSSVCCMYATKQAVMAREHDPDTKATVFFMDTRAFSKGYSAYYKRAQERYGVDYLRCRVSSIKEDPKTANLVLRHVNRELDNGNANLTEEPFDLVVLSVGMQMSSSVRELGKRLQIDLDEYGFCQTAPSQPLQTSQPGIFVAGPFREPKDIPETVIEASGAAVLAENLLNSGRGTLITPAVYPPERDTSADRPRIGVFVCHCGSNIGGFLNVPEVAEYAKALPNVVHSENCMYACSQDSIQRITDQAKALGLNRVVVAACTPLTHEPLFQDSIRQAGLNPYLFEMANIRNQCSWVHSQNKEDATLAAKDLVRMAVGRAAQLTPLYRQTLQVSKRGLVIGGGVAGMVAARALSGQNIPVDLIERSGELGGNLRHLHYLVDCSKPNANLADGSLEFRDAQAYLKDMVGKVQSDPLITVHLQTELLDTRGFKGNFTSKLKTPEGEIEVQHGATIIAVGAREYRGPEYGLGTDSRIMTQQDLEALLAGDTANARKLKSVTMIQCVGPAETLCTRTCCTEALKNALKVKQINPLTQVTMLYQDMRSYGFKERLYTEARRLGVLFVRYDAKHKPQLVPAEGSGAAKPLELRIWEPDLGKHVSLHSDALVLSMPMTKAEGAAELANRLKVTLDLDGWLMEAHVKLRPVDFPTDGIYMAGSAHYPKLIDESIVQAQAAAARAATILTQDTLEVGGAVAHVDPDLCVGCLTCVRDCPYGVPQVKIDITGVGKIAGAAYIEAASCHGCGICVGECPARAIELMHFRHEEIGAKVDALFEVAK
jgi:heterodisulfide reductase subunit A-like polyferredoxin